MEVYKITTGLLGVNTYFLVENGRAIVIDSGENYEKVKEFADSLKVNIEGIYYTHVHFDHIGNAPLFQKDGVKVFIPKKDEVLVGDIGNFIRKYKERFNEFVLDGTFSVGDVISLGDTVRLKVMETPGHTVGSVCFLSDGIVFSGDTLFYENVGRTDFPTGEREALVRSIRKLYSLSEDTVVYPGHGESTTISHEKHFNPYVRG